MGILDNLENSWEMDSSSKNLGMESENLMAKIFSDMCCNSCTCKSAKDHKTESSCLCGNEVCNC